MRSSFGMALVYALPRSPPWARPVLETWFGPCYERDFSEEALREVGRLHWGIEWVDGQVRSIGSEAQKLLDDDLRLRFGSLLDDMDDAVLEEPRASLAKIIMCDQFSRNIYRRTKDAFRRDHLTPAWSKELDLDALHPIEAVFGLLPLEHSEDATNHELCLKKLEDVVDRARKEEFPEHVQRQLALSKSHAVDHADVIFRFGRYPHRNAVLGRESTDEEIEFLSGSAASSWGQ
mmetsp:Transcript_38000/g.121977  ORF Transcript_38000/g.121977 Transcript_38000/m.121977 type:complete len:233 (+) Transcript_38000:38-736(+)